MNNPDLTAPVEPKPDGYRGYLPYAVLIFVLALTFSISSTVPFVALALVYGADAARSFLQTDSFYLIWNQRGITLAFFLLFYLVGKRIDLGRRYVSITILVFVGSFLGASPQLVSVQTTTPLNQQPVTSYLFYFDYLSIVQLIVAAVRNLTVLFGGMSLAYLRIQPIAGLKPQPLGAAEGDGRSGSPWALLLLGFAIVTASYFAGGVIDAIGSRFPGPDQFAFLRASFVTYSPYDSYYSYLFYPFLFFIAFYFLGRKLDPGKSGLRSFAIFVFVAGALGYLVGLPLEYYVRALAAPPSQPFPPFSFGLGFFEGSIVHGLYVLVFGFAAASLGFIRSLYAPTNADRLVAMGLIVGVTLIFAISVYIAISGGSSGTTFVTVTTISSTTASSSSAH